MYVYMSQKYESIYACLCDYMHTSHTLHALHENVAIQPSSHKDCERDGKYLKSSICVDPEGKENQEHHVEQVKHQQSTKVTGTVSSKCGETKMWRPVNRGNSHNISTNESAANSKPSNNSPNDNSGNHILFKILRNRHLFQGDAYLYALNKHIALLANLFYENTFRKNRTEG